MCHLTQNIWKMSEMIAKYPKTPQMQQFCKNRSSQELITKLSSVLEACNLGLI